MHGHAHQPDNHTLRAYPTGPSALDHTCTAYVGRTMVQCMCISYVAVHQRAAHDADSQRLAIQHASKLAVCTKRGLVQVLAARTSSEP